MAINKKLIHFKKKETFDQKVANNEVLDTSIVFIQDSKEIHTHGTTYKSVNWSVLEQYKPTGQYMTIEALEDGLTFTFTNPVTYRINGGAWMNLEANTQSNSINKDETIECKAELTPASNVGIGTFSISKKCNLLGNCNSLILGDSSDTDLIMTSHRYAFYRLFRNNTTIQSVAENFLPSNVIPMYCYKQMFYECTGLKNIPKLNAPSTNTDSYRQMFYGCTSLTTAVVPKGVVSTYCYAEMFKNCTSLTSVSFLATTLDKRYIDYAFLEVVAGCTSLQHITCLMSKITDYTHYAWTSNLPSSGTLTLASGVSFSGFASLSSITPSGWTVEYV